MCIVLDANKQSAFIKGSEDMKPIGKWLEKDGRLVYSDHPDVQKEIQRGSAYQRKLNLLLRQDKAKFIPRQKVQKYQDMIRKNHDSGKYRLKSRQGKKDDSHVIALCLAADIKLLVSDDQGLHADYKHYLPQGKVYKTKAHARLLTPDTCP